jgi:hypothetical protein
MPIKITEGGKYQALLNSKSLGTFETDKEARSAYRKKLREKNREKEKEACRKYYAEHKEYFKRKAAERIFTAEQRERRVKHSAKYYAENKEYFTEYYKKYSAKYYAENKEYFTEYYKKKKERKKEQLLNKTNQNISKNL